VKITLRATFTTNSLIGAMSKNFVKSRERLKERKEDLNTLINRSLVTKIRKKSLNLLPLEQLNKILEQSTIWNLMALNRKSNRKRIRIIYFLQNATRNNQMNALTGSQLELISNRMTSCQLTTKCHREYSPD
jgi:hypothetical protein